VEVGLAGQALREGLRTKEQIEVFVARLRSGEAAFSDEINEGRSRSLGASLAYGFEQAFSERERKKLALLHLFQGHVDVDVLRVMGESEAPWCLPEVRGLSLEEGIALLDRAAEVGLLTAFGGRYYGIHPTLPWFFKSLFERCYTAEDLAAVRAFIGAMGELGNYYAAQYAEGNRGVLAELQAEEANLLHALRLAQACGLENGGIKTMQGLQPLYELTGQRAEWKRLVEEIVPNFVDPKSDGPVPGREEAWSFVTEYRIRLAEEERQLAEAERLQIVLVDWHRRRAASALARPARELKSVEQNAIRSLSVSLHELGQIRRELGRAECVPAYEESLELCEQIGDRTGAAVTAGNLGSAFRDLPAIRDLDRAEDRFRKSLELYDEHDRVGRGRCITQLGSLAYERFRDALTARRPAKELLQYLNNAATRYEEALDLLPPAAINDLAVTHHALGAIYGLAGGLEHAMPHYRAAVQCLEQAGDFFRAALTRQNIAIALFNAGRQTDALEYAEAALRGFEPYGAGAAEEIELTRQLIAQIRGA